MGLQTFLLSAVLASDLVLALAAPPWSRETASRTNGNGFRVEQVRNERFNSTVLQLKNAVLNKYKLARPGIHGRLTGTGTAVATPTKYDSEYLVQVNIDGQTLRLDLDSGSADFWVFSSLLPFIEEIGHNDFDPSEAPDFKYLPGFTWEILYGDGSQAAGVVGTSPVNIGGATAVSQAVELATAVTGSLASDFNMDGIVGLGFNNINEVQPIPQKTFFSNILPTLPLPVFTANLKHQAPGIYDFGFVDNTQFNGALIYTPVNSLSGYWQFDASGYGVGATYYPGTIVNVVVDTGSSLLLMHPAVVSSYWAQVPTATYSSSQEGFVFPCTAAATLPDLVIGVGAAKVTIKGQYLNYAQVSSTLCYGGLQDVGATSINILGDVFFKSNFVVFDAGVNASGPRLGFGAKY